MYRVFLEDRDRKKTSPGQELSVILHNTGPAVDSDADAVPEPGHRHADPVYHRDISDDGTGCYDRLGLIVNDGSRGIPVPAKGIQDIGADG